MASDPKEPERRPGGAAHASETKRGVSAPAAQPATLTRARRTWLQRIVMSIGALATVGCLVAACSTGYLNWRLGQLNKLNLALPAAAAGGPQNFLVVGSDSRSGITASDPDAGAFLNDKQYSSGSGESGRRSDTIMILRIDPSKTQAQLLSLPRDLYVPIAGTGRSDKINAAFAIGQKTLIQTIQNNFGIVINHYVEVDFVGFKKLIDAIGGVSMYFDKPMWDSNTGLNVDHVGCATLDGTQALAFARSRYLWTLTTGASSVDTSHLREVSTSEMMREGWEKDGTADLGRISRQQLLIRTAIPQVEHKALRNPATLNAVMGNVVDAVTFDKGIGTSQLIGLARRFRSFDANHLQTWSFPSTMKWVKGAQVQIPEESQAKPILAQFRAAPAVPEAGVSVEVLNASGVDAQAANVAGALRRVGFEIASTGNGSIQGIDQLDHTQVRYAAGDEAAARLVASHLSVDAELTPIAGMSPGTVVLVTGADFTTVTTGTRSLPAPTTTTVPRSATTSTTSTTVVGEVPAQHRSC